MTDAARAMTEPVDGVPAPGAANARTALERAPLSAWYALAVLTAVTLFAYVDRGVLILQADVIKRALSLSDFQIGLMQGTGVAIFAGIAAYPLSWLADRYDRRIVLSGCILLWSAAVVAGGLAPDYPTLLLSTAMVGGAEAGLVPIIYAMIPELFPPHRRQTANSVYALASQATGGLALALTGALIGGVDAIRPMLPAGMGAIEGWRLAFFLAALPAPVMVLALLTVRVPRRARDAVEHDTAAAGAHLPLRATPLAAPVRPFLRAHWQTFACFYGGVSLAIFGFSCVGSWLPVIYARVFGQTPQQVGSALGAVALVGTALGFLLSIYGMRYLGPRVGTRMNIRLLWVSALGAICMFTVMVFATSAAQMYAIQGAYIFLLTTAVMVYPSALQTLAPNTLRTRIVAIMSVLVAALVAVAPPLVGLVSDHFQHLPNGLILSAVLVAVPALLAAAALLYRCENFYLRTAEAVRRIDDAAQ